MNINNLLIKTAQYEVLTKRLNKKINDYVVYIYKSRMNPKTIIKYNDVTVCSFELYYSNNIKAYEIIGFYSTSPVAAVIGLSLINRFFSPVIPDQSSLTSDSYRILINYFEKNKNNPNLIKKMHPDKPLTPVNAVFLNNPALENLSKDIQIIDVNPSNYKQMDSFTDDMGSIFTKTYEEKNSIPIDQYSVKDLEEESDLEEDPTLKESDLEEYYKNQSDISIERY